MKERYSRRRFLSIATAASGIALAGCSSGSASNEGGSSGTSGGSAGDVMTPAPTGSSGGGTSQSGAWTDTGTVEMTDSLKFEPKRIRVTPGTTVVWKNGGAVAHSVTAYGNEIPDGAAYFASGGFDSERAANDNYPDTGNIAEGESYEYTFETTGTYNYYCIPHEMSEMVGRVKVV